MDHYLEEAEAGDKEAQEDIARCFSTGRGYATYT